jgi:hypothetical protein
MQPVNKFPAFYETLKFTTASTKASPNLYADSPQSILSSTVSSISQFSGAFEKLQNATISFVSSVCPSACPYGTNRLPLDEFS